MATQQTNSPNDPLVTAERIFARNCEVRKIDKPIAREFLNQYHSWGYASCRHCYGLFQRRSTGASENDHSGKLVAVATFSNARKWLKGEREVRSYEWVRYASLSDCRVVGGMSKLLKAFIADYSPDDIMTYAPSDFTGNVYPKLGFKKEGTKQFGSSSNLKFRLKLTEY